MSAGNVARSRRGFLGTVLGAAAAGVAGAFGRPATVRAGGPFVELGEVNETGGDTFIRNIGAHGEGIVGEGPDAGVVGRSKKVGVDGAAQHAGIGVRGTVAGVGTGVEGRAGPGGIGVVASTTGAGRKALSVRGQASFSTAGVIRVTAGQSSVSLVYQRTRRTIVVATLNGQAGAGVSVQHVLPVSGGFTIVLTAPAMSDCKVAYFVIEGTAVPTSAA